MKKKRKRANVIVHILDFIYAFPDAKYSATFRDQHEFKWIHRLRTQLPMGINTMDKPKMASNCRNWKFSGIQK